MKYSEVRDTIKSGDLLAWSHRGWRTWYDIKIQAVRFFTQSEFSHVGVAWAVGGRVFVLEAGCKKTTLLYNCHMFSKTPPQRPAPMKPVPPCGHCPGSQRKK